MTPTGEQRPAPVPSRTMPLGRLTQDLAEADPEFPAVTCNRRTVTRGELAISSNRLARAYAQLGVEIGDFVTIALPNGIEFIEATIALWKLGAIPAPLSSRLPAPELEAILGLVSPKVALGIDQVAGRSLHCLPAGFKPGRGLSADPITPDRVSPSLKAMTSGGSTGRPKVIVHGAPSLINPAGAKMFGLVENGTELVAGPLYHNAPFGLAAAGLALGNHLVVLPKFDAVAALEAIDEHRIDWVNLVPTMMVRMWRVVEQDPDRWDLSSLRQLWHTAAPCPAWVKEAWIRHLGGERVIEMYGGTESQAQTLISGTEWLEHRGSVGRPVLGEIKVFDPEGRVVAPNVIGEIYMRPSPGSRPTYRYIGSEARVTGDGWESLGDIGWMDEDGYLYLCDRRTDLIIAGGANIYPAEVESALLEHPMVDSAVVVGLPDEDLGQRVHAVVQVRGPVAAPELTTFLEARLVRYKVPRSFRFVSEPLRDDAGKVRRAAVQDREILIMDGKQQPS